MATTTLNFSGRDFTAELQRLMELLREELPEYTDLNPSDAGMVLQRLVARETDQLNEYIDRAAGEAFLRWAKFKQSLIDLGGLVGYLPTLASAASTRFQFDRVPGSGDDPIIIPKYTPFGRADGLSYLTAEAVSIASGETTIQVNALQGEVVELDVEPAEFQIVDWSKFPRYDLGASVAAGTVELSHGDPAQYWLEVDSFWQSEPTDRHFLLELNADDGDTVWMVLGDGVTGASAPAETLHIRFIRTAEASGNCGHSLVYLVPDEFEGLITCTQIEPATGGAPAESTASIRRMIPRMTHLQRRAITLPDYETLLEHAPGVLHCQALDRNAAPLWPHEYVVLYVVPDGGGPMSSLLKEQIWTLCGQKGHLGGWKDRYLLFDAVEVPIDITLRYGLVQGYTAEAVTAAIRTVLENLLAAENRTIGGAVTFAELHLAVSAIPGVSWVEFDAPKQDTVVADGRIATTGTITITAGT